MSKLKSISGTNLEKLVANCEKALVQIKAYADKPYPQSFGAIGYAEGTIETLIKQLKGEYTI